MTRLSLADCLLVAVVVLTVLGLVATAFGAPVLPHNLPEPGRLAMVCVPPGLPPYVTWGVGVGFKAPLLLQDNQKRPYAIVTRAYTAAGKKIHTWWLNGAIAMVDPDPQNATEIGWMDDGLLTPDSKPRGADARPSCHWVRPPEIPTETETETRDRT